MLQVYIAGLIYFDGCEEEQRHVFAPDGTGEPLPYYASLWVDDNQVDESATNWWSDSRRSYLFRKSGRGQEDVTVSEFRIPAPATLQFPVTAGNVTCDDLDAKLPKLKKWHNGKLIDFEVDPQVAQTIAEVTIAGGKIDAYRFGQIGLVGWTITDHGALQITAALKEGEEERTVSLQVPAGENGAQVVFTNMHDVTLDEDLDRHSADDHISCFRHLNPQDGATLVAEKPRGKVDQLAGNDAAPALRFLRVKLGTYGDVPPCCEKIVGNGQGPGRGPGSGGEDKP